MDAMNTNHTHGRQRGVTLIELMVALVIGSFLIIGAVQVYTQSRSAYVVNENIARVQENGEFAFDVIEPDLRMASYWGLLSRPDLVEGRASIADPDPLNINPPVTCGPDFVTDLLRPIEGANNTTNWPCVGAGDFMPIPTASWCVMHASRRQCRPRGSYNSRPPACRASSTRTAWHPAASSAAVPRPTTSS